MEKLITEDGYRKALKRFLEICNCSTDSPEAAELEKLTALMEIYEQENCPSPNLN